MEDFCPFSSHSETYQLVATAKKKKKTEQIDDEARVICESIVKTEHQRLTNPAFMYLIPGADRLVRHICIRCIISLIVMSTSDNPSISRKYFTEKEKASKDTNNVNNVDYVTQIHTIHTGN